VTQRGKRTDDSLTSLYYDLSEADEITIGRSARVSFGNTGCVIPVVRLSADVRRSDGFASGQVRTAELLSANYLLQPRSSTSSTCPGRSLHARFVAWADTPLKERKKDDGDVNLAQTHLDYGFSRQPGRRLLSPRRRRSRDRRSHRNGRENKRSTALPKRCSGITDEGGDLINEAHVTRRGISRTAMMSRGASVLVLTLGRHVRLGT